MYIKTEDKLFEIFINRQEIDKRIEELANKIENDFNNEEILFISVLNGSFIFAADLFRKLHYFNKLTFIKLSSYQGLQSTGNVSQAIGLELPITNKNIIIVEDIVETGTTMHNLIKDLKNQNPKSIKLCTLLHKPNSQKFIDFNIDYIGFEIPDEFVIGYGLDYNGYYRNLPDIYKLTVK